MKTGATVAAVERRDGSHRLSRSWAGVGAANAFLAHLESRAFSPATVRAYAFDLVSLARFLDERDIAVAAMVPTDVFDWIDWQACADRAGARSWPSPPNTGRRQHR